MITSVNISLPRKITSSLISTILFEKSMKNIHLKKYNTAVLLTLLCLFTKTETVFAKEANLSHGIIKYYEYTMDFFEIIGFPTIDVFFNIIKMHRPLMDYFKYNKLSNK